MVTMVLLFTEIESLRERVKSKESEINEVRKSFIQLTVAGEVEANTMSRLMGMAQDNSNSHERIDCYSIERSINQSGTPTHSFDVIPSGESRGEPV